MAILIWISILVFGIDSINTLDNTVGKEFELAKDLLATTRYDPKLKPRRNSTEDINVTIIMGIRHLHDVTEIESSVTVSAYVFLVWTDDYLKWDPNDYDGLSMINVAGTDIWKPALVVYNRIGTNFLDDYSDGRALVKQNGTVDMIPTGQITVNCVLSPQYFPFDCHTCYVSFGLKNEKDRRIILSVENTEIGAAIGSPIWDIAIVSNSIDSVRQVCVSSFQLYRKSYYYLMTIVMPSSFLAVLNIVTLFIPSEEGERIGCGMTIFLAFIVFLSQVLDIIPRTSDTTPAIEIYFMMLMVSSIFATIDSVYTSKLPPSRTEEKMMSKDSEMAIITSSKDRVAHFLSNMSKARFHVFCVLATVTFTVATYMVLLDAYVKAKCISTT